MIRVDTNWQYCGLSVIRIENERMIVDIVPALGGKILSLVDKRHDYNVLWRNPGVLPHTVALAANFDDHFAGGWDDVFPTCESSVSRNGDPLPYMGEVWNLALSVQIDHDSRRATISMRGRTPITTAEWTRRVCLDRGSPSVRIETEISNHGGRPIDFNWGSHASLAINQGYRIDAPATHARVCDAGGGSVGQVGDEYEYPLLRRADGSTLDVRPVLPPQTGSYGLHVLDGLHAGWVAATDTQRRRGFGLAFDPEVHRSAWQWMAYGSPNNWYHAVIEAWLSPEVALADAVKNKNARTLQPGQSFSGAVSGVLYDGVDQVSALSSDGHVDAA